jgi:hypothetical protein
VGREHLELEEGRHDPRVFEERVGDSADAPPPAGTEARAYDRGWKVSRVFEERAPKGTPGLTHPSLEWCKLIP